jgi:hypothetical protein
METFSWQKNITNPDDTAFTFANYTIDYYLRRYDEDFYLFDYNQAAWPFIHSTQGNGITVSAPTVTFGLPASTTLYPGEYYHMATLTNISTGVVSELFDGRVIVSGRP